MPAIRSSSSSKSSNRPACDVCGKTFYSNNELKRHRTVHLDPEEKDRLKKRCPYTGCTFKTQQPCNLKAHINGVHLKLRLFKCTIDPANCSVDYTDNSSLIRHEKSEHSRCRKKEKSKEPKAKGRCSRKDELAEPAIEQSLDQSIGPSSDSHLLDPFRRSTSVASSSNCSSSASGNNSDFSFTPSTSPDPCTPEDVQLEYPQQLYLPGASNLTQGLPLHMSLLLPSQYNLLTAMNPRTGEVSFVAPPAISTSSNAYPAVNYGAMEGWNSVLSRSSLPEPHFDATFDATYASGTQPNVFASY